MRKLYLLLIVFVGLLGMESRAQFNFTQDTMEIKLFETHLIYGYTFLSSDYGFEAGMSWRQLQNTLNNDWYLEFCECSNCYTNEFGVMEDSITCQVPANIASQEWKFGIEIGSEAPSQGIFQIEVTDINSGDRDTLTWVVSSALSVHELSNNGNISLYPNPVSKRSGNLTLEYNVPGTQFLSYDIYSILGELVLSGTEQGDNGRIALETNQLAPGMYVYRIDTGSDKPVVGKFKVAQ